MKKRRVAAMKVKFNFTREISRVLRNRSAALAENMLQHNALYARMTRKT